MRVVLLAQTMDTGGMQRQLLELARALPTMGVDVQVVLFYGRGELLEELIAIGVPVHVIGKSSRYDLLRFSYRLRKCLSALVPDVVYAWQPVPSIFASLLHRRRGPVAVVWGVRQSAVKMAGYSAALRWSFRLSILVAARADAIIYNSQSGRRDHEAVGYPSAGGVVVPNGIDADRWQPCRDAGRAWRTTWGVGPNDKLIGVPARIDPMKGHAVLLHAAARLVLSRDNLHFVFIGPGPKPHVEALLLQARRAHVRLNVEGHVTDMLGAYNALDVAVLPSTWGEGFPNVVAEAMSCGVVTVVTDVGDAAAVVNDPSRVVPPNDPDALAVAIQNSLDLPNLDDVARGCRQQIQSRYTVEAMARSTLRVLEDVRMRKTLRPTGAG